MLIKENLGKNHHSNITAVSIFMYLLPGFIKYVCGCNNAEHKTFYPAFSILLVLAARMCKGGGRMFLEHSKVRSKLLSQCKGEPWVFREIIQGFVCLLL